MQHSAIVNKKDNIFVFTRTNEELPTITIWKVINGIKTVLDPQIVVLDLGEKYFKCSFKAPDEDCLLCIRFSNDVSFVRVGTPKPAVLFYSRLSNIIKFKQIDINSGSVLSDIEMIDISDGFYFSPIQIESYSLVQIYSDNGILSSNVLKLPYPGQNGSGPVVTDGYSADFNFIDTGLNMIGFLGDRQSIFDLGLGKWIDSDKLAKASDLAKAVSTRYNLEWAKPENSEDNWIGSYIKYIKCQNEKSGKAILYKPAVTPENNANNFDIIRYDPFNNVVVRGLIVYLERSLETINTGITGARIDFRS